MIENEHSNCMKMVSCKVTIDSQKGYRWHKGALGLLGSVGGVGGVKSVFGGWQGV